MTLFVAGGHGFLGKRVCHLLDKRGIKYVTNSLRDGIDYRDLNQLKNLFDKEKVTTVINCAAYVGGIQFGLKHQGEMYYNNTLMTLNFLECSRIFKIKRLVNPISNCAYPAKATLFKEEEFWDGPLHDSVLAYGFARKASWVGSFAYQQQYGVDWINLILSNMYGPEDHFEPERSHALGALVMRINEAKEKNLPGVVLWGTGKPVREWLYVDDGAEALIRALDVKPVSAPVNVGVASGVSIFELAQMIADQLGYKGKLTTDPTKPDGAPYKTVDGSQGEKLLNWKPEISLEVGLKKTIDWYLNHK
jgi:GDP-L-fucose synthase